MRRNELSNRDVRSITTTLDEMNREFTAHDYPAWLSHWTEDAVIMPPNEHRVHGRTAMIEFAESYADVDALELTNVNIEGRDDLAIVTTNLRLRTKGAYGEPMKQVIVLQKEDDGEWRFSRVIFNSSEPS